MIGRSGTFLDAASGSLHLLYGRARAKQTLAYGAVLLSAGLASLILVACTVADSARVDLAGTAFGYAPVCNSTLGSYALPKAFLEIQIAQGANAAPDIVANSHGGPIATLRHPDPSFVFCLDYLASPFSDDNIQVMKWPLQTTGTQTAQNTQNQTQTGLQSSQDNPGGTLGTFITTQSGKEAFLGAVTFNVTDQTAYIIEALIRAGFIAASGNPNFSITRAGQTGQSSIVADLEYDPFDRVESAEVNSRLQKLGVCLVLESYTFDFGVRVNDYCNNPLRYGMRQTLYTKAVAKLEEGTLDPHWPGLLYRPRYPYRLFVFRNIDPKGSREWKLSKITTVKLENLSPIISLDITRAMFAGKNMSFVFNEGTLQTACVAKNSEIEGFVQIPLQVAKSIVALPASIASMQIGNANNQAQLAQMEQQLYLTQNAYLKTMMGQSTAAPSGAPTTVMPPPLPDPTNFTTPADLTQLSPISTFGSDAFQNPLTNICQGKA